MNIAPLVALICLFPLSAVASEPSLATGSDLDAVSISDTAMRNTVILGRSPQKVARLSAEGRLGQELGLEPSGTFTFDGPELNHDAEELEL